MQKRLQVWQGQGICYFPCQPGVLLQVGQGPSTGAFSSFPQRWTEDWVEWDWSCGKVGGRQEMEHFSSHPDSYCLVHRSSYFLNETSVHCPLGSWKAGQ